MHGQEETTVVPERSHPMMFHPIHLHGHTLAVQHATATGPQGHRDRSPIQRLAVDLHADNPWHCVVRRRVPKDVWIHGDVRMHPPEASRSLSPDYC